MKNRSKNPAESGMQGQAQKKRASAAGRVLHADFSTVGVRDFLCNAKSRPEMFPAAAALDLETLAEGETGRTGGVSESSESVEMIIYPLHCG